MAADVADELKAPHGEHDTAPPAKGNPKKKLLIGAIVLVVVAVQAIVTWFLLPSSASDAHGKPDAKDHASSGAHEPEEDAPEGDVAEVALGDFSFSNTTAMAGSILHVDFKLAAVTSSRQASSLEERVKTNTARIRQAVNKILRSSNLEELNDPHLGTIKRLIKEDINRLLRKTYVNEVVITDVRIIEQ